MVYNRSDPDVSDALPFNPGLLLLQKLLVQRAARAALAIGFGGLLAACRCCCRAAGKKLRRPWMGAAVWCGGGGMRLQNLAILSAHVCEAMVFRSAISVIISLPDSWLTASDGDHVAQVIHLT